MLWHAKELQHYKIPKDQHFKIFWNSGHKVKQFYKDSLFQCPTFPRPQKFTKRGNSSNLKQRKSNGWWNSFYLMPILVNEIRLGLGISWWFRNGFVLLLPKWLDRTCSQHIIFLSSSDRNRSWLAPPILVPQLSYRRRRPTSLLGYSLAVSVQPFWVIARHHLPQNSIYQQRFDEEESEE